MKKLILLHVLFFNIIANPPNPSTQLGILVEDLSILARITNGIALYSEEVDLHDIIAEILKCRMELIERILKMEKIEVNTVIESVLDAKRLLESSKSNLFSGKTVKETFSIGNLFHLPMEQLLQYKRINNGITAQNFLNLLRNAEIVGELKPCDRKTLERFFSFLQFEKKEMHLLKWEQVDLFQGVSSSNGLINLKRCINELEKYETTYNENKLIISSKKEMAQIQKLREFLGNVQHFNKPIKNNYAQQITLLAEKIGLLAPFLQGLPVKGKIEESMKNWFEIISELSEGRLNSEEVKINFTSGFRNSFDVSKVEKDLKSSFFREGVARGRSTKELTIGMRRFFELSKKMEKLEKTWKKLIDSYISGKETMDQVFLDVKQLIKYEKTQNEQQILVEQSKIAKDCSNLMKNMENMDFQHFDHAFALVHQVWMNAGTIKNLSENIIKDDSARKSTLKILEFIQLEHPQTQVAEMVDNFHKLVRKHPDYANFIKELNYFLKLLNSEKDIEYGVRHVQMRSYDVQRFDLSRFVQESQALEVLECFLTKHFDFGTVQKSFSFISHLLNSELDEMRNSMLTMLEGILNIQKDIDNIIIEKKNPESQKSSNYSIFLSFEKSMELSQRIGKGVEALAAINKLLLAKKTLKKTSNLGKTSMTVLLSRADPLIVNIWVTGIDKIKKLIQQLEDLEKLARKLRRTPRNPWKLMKIFEKAQEIIGLPVTSEDVKKTALMLEENGDSEDALAFHSLSTLHLDFSRFSADLTAAMGSVDTLKKRFDKMFGLNPKEEKDKVEVIVEKLTVGQYLVVVLICIGVFLLAIIVFLIAHGFTETGREQYTVWYIYYFRKHKEYEKRWRYSMFADTVEEVNMTVDATREVNPINLKKVLKKGAYVNVYNRFGNTCLHSATKKGYHQLVKILIEHGADRQILNHQNKRPEEMILTDWESHKDPAIVERFRKTVKIYNKYRKTRFRQKVPEYFPPSSYHIYMESRTNDEVTDHFMDVFQAITSTEILNSTTHCVVAVNKDGRLETNDIEILVWIFKGVIIVEEQWMSDCIADEKLIEKDYKYLVKDVVYNGHLYENVILPWTYAMSKGKMPFLFGVHMILVVKECEYYVAFSKMVVKLGGTLYRDLPEAGFITKGSHPYLHAHLNPIWIITDGHFDMTPYLNNPDGLYEVMTLERFIHILLERKENPNQSPNPLPVVEINDEF